MSNLKAKMKLFSRQHSRGYAVCLSALTKADEIFKDLEGFQHCQTSEDGSIEVIIGNEGCPGDYAISEALQMLEDQE